MAITTAMSKVSLTSISEAWTELRRFDALKVDGYVNRGQIRANACPKRGLVIEVPTPGTIEETVRKTWTGGEQLLLEAQAGQDVSEDIRGLLEEAERPPQLPVLARDTWARSLPPTISLDITEHAAKQLSRACKFESFSDFRREIDRAPDLAAARFNRWFQDVDVLNSDRKRPTTVSATNHLVRAFASDPALLAKSGSPWMMRALLSASYKCIDTTDILSVLFTLLGQNQDRFPQGKVDVEASFDDAKCWFTVTNRSLVKPTKRGDVVAASIRGGTSDVGTGSATVETRCVVLACINGMTTGRNLSMRHLGRKMDNVPDGFFSETTQRAQQATLMLELRDAMNAAFDETEFYKVIQQMDLNQEKPVTAEEAKPVFEAIKHKLTVPDAVKDALFSQFMGEHHTDGSPNRTKDGVVQAITAIGRQKALVDYNTAIEWEDLGGKVHAMPVNQFDRLVKAATDDPKRAAKLL